MTDDSPWREVSELVAAAASLLKQAKALQARYPAPPKRHPEPKRTRKPKPQPAPKPAPPTRQWCSQCEQRVDATTVARCGSRFCSLKPKDA